jgi:3-oxoacyl-[acyl-carrier-protein] synthase III
MLYKNSVIVGTGSFLPEKTIGNSYFLDHIFYKNDGTKIEKPASEIIQKLEDISGIKNRRYAGDSTDTVDLAVAAGFAAIADAGIDKEKIDGIIVAHNFGNLKNGLTYPLLLPNLAALVKNRLGIKNHHCYAFDLLFGCPGWIQAMVQAHQSILAGMSKNVLVIGTEILSRIVDAHDLDSMLFGDGAGAVVLQAQESETRTGILATHTYSHCLDDADYLKMGVSYNAEKQTEDPDMFIKMNGRNVYRYAVTFVPDLITECLAKSELHISEIDMFLFHQANAKLIKAVGDKLFAQHQYNGDYSKLVPITLQQTGNSSVATVPTLLDEVLRGKVEGFEIKAGQKVLMASVGSGMHANCLIYQF